MDTFDQSPPGSVENESSRGRDLRALSPTVLVVDDDNEMRASIVDLLEEHGYTAVESEDGQRARDYLLSQPLPACMILDLWMPGLDGWSVASQVASGALPRVPILLITAGESDAGYPVPTRYVLRKPLAAERLLVLVREMVRAGA